MNDPASTSTTGSRSTAAGDAAGFCAVLALDAQGRVTGASSSARQLWQTAENELVGDHFASLFVIEVVSNDPEFLEAQWDVLLASALDRPATLTAQPREGAPREVSVRLEKNLGPAAGYLATIQPPATPLTAGAATPDSGGRSAALQLLADKGAAGFFDLNLESNEIHFSTAWKKLLGYTAAELTDTIDTWHNLIHPDDSAAAPDKIGRKLAAAGAASRPFSVEFRMKHQRGHWVWIQCIGVQVTNAAGEVQRVVGVHLDISERKELEEASLANDARIQDLTAATAPLAAFELDFAGNAFWFSPSWEKLLGYDEGELAPEPA